MDDLLGLGKSTDKLISTVERAIGAVYGPYRKRRDADAEAYRHTLIEDAKTDAKARKIVELAKANAAAEAIDFDNKAMLQERLQARLQHEALQKQRNIESIVEGALGLQSGEPSADEVDDDWLSQYFGHAQSISSADMQKLWSRVLALEVGTPGRFSPKALETLRKMTRREAIDFQAACRLAVGTSNAGGRFAIYSGASRDHWFSIFDDARTELSEFGLPVLRRVSLAQIGLIFADELVSSPMPRGEQVVLRFARTQLKLTAKRNGARLTSYALTPIGAELAALIDADEDADYIAALRSSFEKYFDIRTEQAGRRD